MVPGRSLRLLVFDRVPWPRPDILHKARRVRFGGKGYDDGIARARIAQAFGRLIRRAGDSGQFVLLSGAVPSRFLSAFPPATPVRRVTLDEAIRRMTMTPPEPPWRGDMRRMAAAAQRMQAKLLVENSALSVSSAVFAMLR